MQILVVANDVTPEFGLPVAAPGLRAWSLALGLRAHGHKVDLVVNERSLARAGRGGLPPSAAGVVPLDLSLLDDYVTTHAPDAVVFTNSNHFARLSSDHDALLVYDFFAPKMLERTSSRRGHGPSELRRLREEKVAALGRADVIALNGAKKHGYVVAWLLQCDRDPASVPIVQVPFGVPVIEPEPHEGPLRLAVAGYVQEWSGAGEQLDRLLDAMDGADVEVHLVLARHWGGIRQEDLGGGYSRLFEHPSAIRHDPMAFDDFRQMLAAVDATIDLFGHNLEREYAMVSRTLVAMCSGAAVIHPDFTEVAALMEPHDAGWLLDRYEQVELVELCKRLANERDEVLRRRRNAAQLAREVLAPIAATAELSRTLNELSA